MQSATVLAVLAGYTLLLVLTVNLNRFDRRQAHQRLVEQLQGALVARVATPEGFDAAARQLLLPGIEVKLRPAGVPRPPRLHWDGERVWLESVSPLTLRDGQPRRVELRQDVTASIEQQNLSLQLLSAAAGGAALFTALLLRPVMTYGLVRPLQTLSDQLAAYRSPPSPPPPLDVSEQPEELQPIAASFNAMQERLAASWERQRAFVDGVAHELRTPITLISGHAQSLQRQGGVAVFGPSLTLILAEARRMGAMVSDMLDLARKDAGRLQLRSQPLDVEDVLLEAYERLAPGSGGRLRLESPPEDGALPLAAGDPDRLAQCLVALIDNALRYAPAPSPIRLSVEARGGELVLHVRDRGPGVAPEERQVIFERFVRGGAAVDTRGSGIGLSVVQLLMEAMGGRISVGDAPGGGADFQLHLPAYELQPLGRVVSAPAPPSA